MQTSNNSTGFDQLERRCPRLGGPVPFAYCRTAGDSAKTCFKVFDCWWEYFDVVAYMRHCLSAQEYDQLVRTRTPDKTASLMEMIQQARQRLRSDSDTE